MKLEPGKTYRARNGTHVGPMRTKRLLGFTFLTAEQSPFLYDHEDEEEGQIAAITTAWAHMFGEEKRTVSQFVEALLEGHKSAESGRRARADAAMSAVAASAP